MLRSWLRASGPASAFLPVLVLCGAVCLACGNNDAARPAAGPSSVADLPPDIELDLMPQEPSTVTIEVALPDPEAGEIGADVMILFDRSGSFGDDLTTFRNEAGAIVDALTESFPDLRIGLASFVDAPCLGFGFPDSDPDDGRDDGDFGYELNLALPDSATGDPAMAFGDALDALDIRDGNDVPESQLEAIRQALTGAGLVVDPRVSPSCAPVANIAASDPGFERNRVRFLIVATDADFHEPSDSGYPYPTGVQGAIDVALETGTTIFFLDSRGTTDQAADDIAAATGGDVFVLGAASQEVVAAIRDAVSASISEVEIRLEPTSDGGDFVESVDPAVQIVDLLVDRSVSFDVTFVGGAARQVEDRTYAFELVISADGAELERIVVNVTIPGTGA